MEPNFPEGMVELSSQPNWCFVCCLHAVTRGVDFDDVDGDTLADGTHLHPPVTTINGTAVCWYHVSHVGTANVLSDLGYTALTATRIQADQQGSSKNQ
jgi:hypothetical protein